jgi:hypothetical protein
MVELPPSKCKGFRASPTTAQTNKRTNHLTALPGMETHASNPALRRLQQDGLSSCPKIWLIFHLHVSLLPSLLSPWSHLLQDIAPGDCPPVQHPCSWRHCCTSTGVCVSSCLPEGRICLFLSVFLGLSTGESELEYKALNSFLSPKDFNNLPLHARLSHQRQVCVFKFLLIVNTWMCHRQSTLIV